MKNTALITGASSGIGLELAKIHASKGRDLVLVARSTANLEALKTDLENQYKIQVLIISKDLSQRDAAKEVYDETTRRGIQIDYLINNAGFGDFGHFAATDWDKEEQMINLNMTTLTHFTKLYLQDMIKRNSGKIMNVASTASFQPGPTMAVYCATKAYVLSFSEAVNNEVSDKGVSVTALCPGATNTHFKSAAGMDNSKLFKNKNLPTGQEVAKYGYAAMMKGTPVAIHGTINFILANSSRFIPRPWVVKVVRMMVE
jgi:short-subunit dehydrogenase